MKKICLQKTSSLNPSTTQKKKKNNLEQQPFTVPAHQATVTDPNIDLSGYRQPQPGDMIANVMRSIEAGTANKPAFNHKRQGNELTAPPRHNYQPIINPIRQLTAPRQDSRGKGLVVQPKLTIGRPNDKYEQEADRVAAQVVRQINRPAPMSMAQGGMVQGKEEESGLRMKPMPKISVIEAMPEEGEIQLMPIVQRREAIGGGEASPELSGEINRARGAGQALDAGLQQSMGEAMGADFRRVRVHTDERADRLNRSLSSRAFTTGEDLFFKKGEYQPGSRGGQGLIAHELAHVEQQDGGGSDGVEKRTVQRVVCIAKEDGPRHYKEKSLNEDTIIEGITFFQHLDWARDADQHTEDDRTYITLNQLRSQKLEEKEAIYIVGHGEPGKVDGVTGDEIASVIVEAAKNQDDGWIGQVYVSACFSAVPRIGSGVFRELGSIVQTVRESLRRNNLSNEVLGAKGETITHANLIPGQLYVSKKLYQQGWCGPIWNPETEEWVRSGEERYKYLFDSLDRQTSKEHKEKENMKVKYEQDIKQYMLMASELKPEDPEKVVEFAKVVSILTKNPYKELMEEEKESWLNKIEWR